MVAGAVGGIALWTVIFPADVVKSRIQVANLTESFTHVTLQIIKNEGNELLF